MKKSLQEALEEARVHSLKHPDIICYVVDKPRCKAKVYTVGWLALHTINCEGYHPVATFKNGVKSI